MARKSEHAWSPASRRRALGGFAVTIGALVLVMASGALPGASNGCSEHVQERLFFGLDGPAGTVSDAEWEAFVESVVTPRFPAGLTVLEATGQWRGRDMRVNREPSRVVEIIHDQSKDAARRVTEIAAEYKTRYRQESVLIARARVEVCL
jgi:uncharacterized protein DUF3574